MLLPLQSFTMLVQQMSAGVQGASQALIDLSVGSVLRAVLEASASVALWMQWLILQVLSMTRAATSNGPDLDSWMADFSLTRLPAVAASGVVTFARYSTGLGTVIPVGTLVRTSDGTQSFSVVADPSNSAWDGVSSYNLAASAASVDLPVQAGAAGSAGNVQAGSITLLASAIAGVDTVVNAAPLLGGMDAESDAALRARFSVYINSRSLATPGAIDFAIGSVQQGVRYAIAQNQDTAGDDLPGNFCVTVDDGTGAAPSPLLSLVTNAVDAVRPIGSTFSVAGPVVTIANVGLTVETSNPTTRSTVVANIVGGIQSWIAGLPMGGTLAISKIIAIAHATDASVVSVMDVAINGSANDLVASANGVLLAGTVMVS